MREGLVWHVRAVQLFLPCNRLWSVSSSGASLAASKPEAALTGSSAQELLAERLAGDVYLLLKEEGQIALDELFHSGAMDKIGYIGLVPGSITDWQVRELTPAFVPVKFVAVWFRYARAGEISFRRQAAVNGSQVAGKSSCGCEPSCQRKLG